MAPPPEFDFDQLRNLEDQLRQLENLEGIREGVVAGMAQGGFQEPFFFPPAFVPPELVGLVLGSLALLLLMLVGYPIARAVARRIDRRTAAVGGTAPSGEVVARLERIEHAIETMAVEIERISEGQRFTTRLLTEQSRGSGVGFGDRDR